jgi:hypothetical protein
MAGGVLTELVFARRIELDRGPPESNFYARLQLLRDEDHHEK